MLRVDFKGAGRDHAGALRRPQVIRLHEIFAGALPFVVVMALVVLLLIAVPQLSLLFK